MVLLSRYNVNMITIHFMVINFVNEVIKIFYDYRKFKNILLSLRTFILHMQSNILPNS